VDHDLKRAVSAAEGYAMLGMVEEADTELDGLGPELVTHPAVLGARVQIFMAVEDWAAAVEISKRLVEFASEEAGHWILLGNVMRRADSVEAAEEVLLEGVEQHPKVATIHYNLACYAAVQGRLDTARMRLAEATKLDEKAKLMALDDPDLESIW